MGILKKNISPRRKQLREAIAADRFQEIVAFVNSGMLASALIFVFFAALCSYLLSTSFTLESFGYRPAHQILAVTILVFIISAASGIYVYRFNYTILKNPIRSLVLACLFLTLIAVTKFSMLFDSGIYIAVAVTVGGAIILSIVYDQRFALAMGLSYSMLACLAAGRETDFSLFLTMISGTTTSCFLLREIRTRIKILEVGIFAGAAVFVISFSTDLFDNGLNKTIFAQAGWTAFAVVCISVVIQAFLPIIERVFRIATSMTLLDYSDANQPLLKKLAMDAPGTYSHSLLIGSISEAAAESIGANGLLCRVGAYYHDIGKIGKPRYFVENQMGTASRHDQLSPAMSQLIISGHVKDGLELAQEYNLPAVIRQFIETHHGTTLIEYFYEEARKKANGDMPPAESEFRYPGPRPRTKEAAIVMLSDAVEGAVRAQTEVTPTKIETVVHNMAMKRLQDGQFDECDLTLKELSKIEETLAKSLAGHYHGRIAYPTVGGKPHHQTVIQQGSAPSDQENENA
ncbi:MAG: 7TM receptor with intracellular HD hydrolase [Planctomycetes bacterium ADurb.Bin401]|nr:MAG: 7TM receptor with intracellular HD hydrolase [Planctomycetes bacterium ADurb.Bin401]